MLSFDFAIFCKFFEESETIKDEISLGTYFGIFVVTYYLSVKGIIEIQNFTS